MFDVGASELLLIVIVAVVVIGPKDMPMALRTAGRWIGKMRKVSSHFRAGLDTMVREAELEDMEKKWREQNEAIMRAHPGADVIPSAESIQAPTISDSVAEPVALPAPEAAEPLSSEPATAGPPPPP